MKISELVAHKELIHRRVGIEVPAGRSTVGVAVDLYRNLGIDVVLEERLIFVMVGEVLAGPVQAALERRTGVMAFNDWLD